MNKFKEIKNILSCQDVVQRYLGLPVKQNSTGNWYISPFRREKTASFCVSRRGIHDFGDSVHYDIISFVARYYNCTQYQALKILCNDFGISVSNEYESKQVMEMLKQKREEERQIREKIENWFNMEFQHICDELQINQKCINIFSRKCNFKVLSILYQEQVELEYRFEILFNADDEAKKQLYLMSLEVIA